LQPAPDRAQAEDQQDVADDRAGDRRLDQVVKPGPERHDRDDQLGGVAEGRVQQPADAFTQPLCELLRRPAHQARERDDRQRGRDEDRDPARVEHVLQRQGDGNEDQQEQQPVLAKPRHGHLCVRVGHLAAFGQGGTQTACVRIPVSHKFGGLRQILQHKRGGMNGDLHSGGAVDHAAVANAHSEHADAPEFAREMWKTRLGFVLAAVGSAVGLGNMWRFPYITAEYGGAAFVVLYIAMTLAVGIPVMLAEFTIGRGTRKSSISALRLAGGKGWVPLGFLFVLTGFLILSFYSVIAGWVTRYALAGIFGGFPEDTGAYFDLIASGTPAMGFHLFVMAVTIAIVMGGVEKGIERASVIMIPALFFIVLGLAVWAATLSGSGAGYAFYLTPSFSDLFNANTLAAAASQAFFSLSLGMGAMLTFSSYLSRKESLPREASVIAFSDFSVAFLAGLVVFPV